MQIAPELKFPGYEQEAWVRLNHYAARPWKELVVLWCAYNRHLAEVIQRIAPETLRACVGQEAGIRATARWHKI